MRSQGVFSGYVFCAASLEELSAKLSESILALALVDHDCD